MIHKTHVIFSQGIEQNSAHISFLFPLMRGKRCSILVFAIFFFSHVM